MRSRANPPPPHEFQRRPHPSLVKSNPIAPAPPPPLAAMHLILNLLQARRRLSRSLAVTRKQAMARAASSGVAVRRLVCSRVLLREARMVSAAFRSSGESA